MPAVDTASHMGSSIGLNRTEALGTACRGRPLAGKGCSPWESVVSTCLGDSIVNSRPGIVRTFAIRRKGLANWFESCSCFSWSSFFISLFILKL